MTTKIQSVSGGWCPVPNLLMCDAVLPELTGAELKWLLLFFKKCSGSWTACLWPVEVEKAAGVSRGHIKRVTKSLEEMGLIKRVAQVRNYPPLYRFTTKGIRERIAEGAEIMEPPENYDRDLPLYYDQVMKDARDDEEGIVKRGGARGRGERGSAGAPPYKEVKKNTGGAGGEDEPRPASHLHSRPSVRVKRLNGGGMDGQIRDYCEKARRCTRPSLSAATRRRGGVHSDETREWCDKPEDERKALFRALAASVDATVSREAGNDGETCLSGDSLIECHDGGVGDVNVACNADSVGCDGLCGDQTCDEGDEGIEGLESDSEGIVRDGGLGMDDGDVIVHDAQVVGCVSVSGEGISVELVRME